MPKATLTTKASLEAIPYSRQGQPVYWCTELTGFGVRAGAREKTFILERRVNGIPRRVTIGRAGTITLQKARQDAEQLIGEMVGGTDPVARKRDQTAGGMTLRHAWELHKQAMKSKNGSDVTREDYQKKIDCHLSDWIDRPLVNITRRACNERHREIGENNGKYMANGVMRVLRAIWNRARRQYPDLPESPTRNVDFYPEFGRTAVITDWIAWWKGVQRMESSVRRDFYIWLALTGCRSSETMTMELKNVDLKNGVMFFPITKTEKLELPLSDFLMKLLQDRIERNIEEFGADCPWIFPSATSESGHVEEAKLNEEEPKLFVEPWSPHTLRHSWITNADQKVKIPDAHQRQLTNHKPRRRSNSGGDAHAGYIHPDLGDLRESQQRMTDYIMSKMKPTSTKCKKKKQKQRGEL